MRNIHQFTGASITGVTINQYQVNRGNEINKKVGLAENCVLKQGDFCKLAAFKDNTFDKVFAIESTCHAPNRCDVYDQVFRVLKPGGIFLAFTFSAAAGDFNISVTSDLPIRSGGLSQTEVLVLGL